MRRLEPLAAITERGRAANPKNGLYPAATSLWDETIDGRRFGVVIVTAERVTTFECIINREATEWPRFVFDEDEALQVMRWRLEAVMSSADARNLTENIGEWMPVSMKPGRSKTLSEAQDEMADAMAALRGAIGESWIGRTMRWARRCFG